MSIEEIHNQLCADVELADNFVLSALSRGDQKAVRIWQETLAAAKAAEEAVSNYRKVLAK